MSHIRNTQNCTVFILGRELTRSAIYGSQKFDSQKWPTVLVDKIKRKPRNFEAYLCRSLPSLECIGPMVLLYRLTISQDCLTPRLASCQLLRENTQTMMIQ